MDHDWIEREQIVDRYLMGRTTPDETASFEEHYLSCETCLEQLEVAESFQTGLKQAVAEDAAKTAVAGRLGLLAWLARTARSPRAGLVAGALLIALVLPLGVAYRQLGQARDANADLARQLTESRAPQANTLVLPLSPERAGPGEGPSVRFRLPEPPGWIVVSLELDRPELDGYAVELIDPDGVKLWTGARLRPNQFDALTVSLHSSLLAAGDYELRVEGLPAKGEPVAVGTFALRVLPPG